MEVAGAEKSQARCGRSRGDEAALGARGRGEGAAPVLRRRRRQGSDVLGQRGEAKPGGSERAPVAGWRYGGDGVWRRTSEGSERREIWGSGARPLRAWVVAAEGNEEEGSRDRERAGNRLGLGWVLVGCGYRRPKWPAGGLSLLSPLFLFSRKKY